MLTQITPNGLCQEGAGCEEQKRELYVARAF